MGLERFELSVYSLEGSSGTYSVLSPYVPYGSSDTFFECAVSRLGYRPMLLKVVGAYINLFSMETVIKRVVTF
tara:strand:+ start:1182 stop:1400 length:219 start_codon:yes stop_codon:yes gene_type:complete